MDVLLRIKHLVLYEHVDFTRKALEELEADGLTTNQAIESILNAQSIFKILRSRSRYRRYAGEKLYVIKSFSYDGTLIYTKGSIVQSEGRKTFYIFNSAKLDTLN